jgi:hypothetical protein
MAEAPPPAGLLLFLTFGSSFSRRGFLANEERAVYAFVPKLRYACCSPFGPAPGSPLHSVLVSARRVCAVPVNW